MAKKFACLFIFLFLIVQTLSPYSNRVWGASSEPYWLGWYSEQNTTGFHPVPDAYKWLAIHGPWGINLVVHQELPSLNNLDFYLNKAQEQGIKVFVTVLNEGVIKSNWDQLRNFINRYKDHPAVFGWYLADEPEIHSNVNVGLLETAYQVIKGVDPVHPIGIGFCGMCADPGRHDDFYGALDIILLNQYPFTKNSYPFQNIASVTKKVNTYLTQAKNYGKKLVMVLQGFELDVEGNRYRAPTKQELRYMLYTSVIRDTSGTLFYTDYLADDIPEHKILENVNSLIKEAGLIDGAIKNGKFNSGVSRNDTYINYRFGANGDNFYYLITVNESNWGHSVTFTLPASIKSTQQAEVINEGRTITVNNKSFSDNFSAYQVHVYKLTSAITVISTPAPSSPPSPILTVTPTPKPKILGDYNGDGHINAPDYAIFANYWQTNDPAADLDNSGAINVLDYELFKANYGK